MDELTQQLGTAFNILKESHNTKVSLDSMAVQSILMIVIASQLGVIEKINKPPSNNVGMKKEEIRELVIAMLTPLGESVDNTLSSHENSLSKITKQLGGIGEVLQELSSHIQNTQKEN